MSEPTAIIYSFDTFRPNAIGVDAPEANGPAFVERTFLNFDSLENGPSPRDYKTLKSVYPIGRIPEGSPPIAVSWGAVDHAGDGDIDWCDPLPYDSTTEGQLDAMVSGRYLSLRVEYDGFDEIRIVGFDLEIEIQGSRG